MAKICTTNNLAYRVRNWLDNNNYDITGKLYLNIMHKLHICKYWIHCLETIYRHFTN